MLPNPNDDSYLCATSHSYSSLILIVLASSMYLGPTTSTQSASDAGNDLDSLTNMDLTHFDFTPSVSFEFVASPHFVDLTIFSPSAP